MKVLLQCQYCGVTFTAKPWEAKKRKYCSQKCYHIVSLPHLESVRILWTKGNAPPAWTKGLTKETSSKVAAMATKLRGRKNVRLSQWIKSHGYTPPNRKGCHVSPKGKINIGIAQKLKWRDLEMKDRLVSAVMKGNRKRPTLPEKIMQGILNKHFPEFKYNGDFGQGIVLAGLVPDFVNTNGKKQVIEVFGDYFHSAKVVGSRQRGTEAGKIEAYKSVGFNCLVIWQSDLEHSSEDIIISKINQFCNGYVNKEGFEA
jgi:hypothetical protein